MKQKPYHIAGPHQVGSCVAKITYDGKKYVIVKCKQAYDSLKRIENGLNAFIRGGANNPEGLYYYFYDYVKKHPRKDFKVDILLESDSGYKLLRFEQEQLNAGRNDRAFMNNQLTAYIPAYNDETQMFGWLTRGEVLNFKNWLARNKVPAAKKKL